VSCRREHFRAHKKTLDPGFRRDDGWNFTVALTTTVIPAKAGIQRLSLHTLKNHFLVNLNEIKNQQAS
jgi:hypothetical protein